LVAFSNVAGDVLLPLALNPWAVVEIEFAVHNFPGFRINRSEIPIFDGPGTISTILRSVGFRVAGKQVAVFGTGKPPGSPIPLILVLGTSLDRRCFCEVSDRVSTPNGNPIKAVDLRLFSDRYSGAGISDSTGVSSGTGVNGSAGISRRTGIGSSAGIGSSRRTGIYGFCSGPSAGVSGGCGIAAGNGAQGEQRGNRDRTQVLNSHGHPPLKVEFAGVNGLYC